MIWNWKKYKANISVLKVRDIWWNEKDDKGGLKILFQARMGKHFTFKLLSLFFLAFFFLKNRWCNTEVNMPLSQLFETCYWHQIQNEHLKKQKTKTRTNTETFHISVSAFDMFFFFLFLFFLLFLIKFSLYLNPPPTQNPQISGELLIPMNQL